MSTRGVAFITNQCGCSKHQSSSIKSKALLREFMLENYVSIFLTDPHTPLSLDHRHQKNVQQNGPALSRRSVETTIHQATVKGSPPTDLPTEQPSNWDTRFVRKIPGAWRSIFFPITKTQNTYSTHTHGSPMK